MRLCVYVTLVSPAKTAEPMTLSRLKAMLDDGAHGRYLVNTIERSKNGSDARAVASITVKATFHDTDTDTRDSSPGSSRGNRACRT